MTRDDVKILLDTYSRYVNTAVNPYPPQSSLAFVNHSGEPEFKSKIPRIKHTPPEMLQLQGIINKLLMSGYIQRKAMTSVLLRHVRNVKPSDVAGIIQESSRAERNFYIMGLDFIIVAYAFSG